MCNSMLHVVTIEDDVPHNRFLLQRRQGWYFRVVVPPSLCATLGKRETVRSLKTCYIE